jgi:hypothetical protein
VRLLTMSETTLGDLYDDARRPAPQ